MKKSGGMSYTTGAITSCRGGVWDGHGCVHTRNTFDCKDKALTPTLIDRLTIPAPDYLGAFTIPEYVPLGLMTSR